LLPVSISKILGIETTISHLLLRTHVDDADPFVDLIYQLLHTHKPSLSIKNHADVLYLLPTCRPSQFPRLLGTESTINHSELHTYIVDADPFVHFTYQSYTHTPSKSI
jgi:hypothetical protein